MNTALYRDESSNPRANAQANLWGRTHYCDDDTLRYHKSRITWCDVRADGKYLLIVEAYAVDYQNTQRAFRGVIFDLTGNPVYRPKLDAGYSSTAIALKHAVKALQGLQS